MNDVNSLSHTSWNCKYHVVFAPKYRRKVFFGENHNPTLNVGFAKRPHRGHNTSGA